MHLSGKIAESMLADKEEERVIRLAGLLHDVGHGPFSHVSETIVERFYDKSKVNPANGIKIHELITHGLISRNTELQSLLSEWDREQIIGILNGSWGDRILRDIVSGPLDADKQDYLLRDSYYCGVKYGVFDINRLIDTLVVYNDREEKMIAVTPDGTHALEQFILAKYYMTTQVYRHKVRLVTDAMIIRAIELGILNDEIDYLKKIYTFDNSDLFFKEWLKWNDENLTTLICSEKTPDGYCKLLFHNLLCRKLYKRIFSRHLRDFKDPHVRRRVSDQFKKVVKVLETRIGEKLEIDPNLLIVNKFTIQSVREQSRNSVGPILVLRIEGIKTFEDESTLFNSIDEAEKDEFIEVYAPVTYQDDKDKRQKLSKWNEEISNIIESVINNLQKEDGE